MTDTREYPRPVEGVARAIYEDRNGHGCVVWPRYQFKDPYRRDARAALDYLLSNNLLNDIGVTSVRAEQASHKETGK